MTFDFTGADYSLHNEHVSKAAQAARDLVALWPLTDHMNLDNDLKYGENFQVRQAQEFALLVADNITIADTEYVYEGADEIPGRPQEIVDALLSAIDAYDAAYDFQETLNVSELSDAAEAISGKALSAESMSEVHNLITQAQSEVEHADNLDLEQEHMILVAAEIYMKFAAITAQFDSDNINGRAVAAALFLKGVSGNWGLPPIVVDHERLISWLSAPLNELVEDYAQLAAQEWERHRVDVLWNPDEAKRLAKEEDERKSKEALAAKFAHIKDDPNKPHVEL